MLPENWDEFRKHRKKLKAPMTEHAESLILAKLEKWQQENGANPVDVINESIEKGWRGVFLNGHGRKEISPPLEATRWAGTGSLSSPPICCSCGGSLEAGFIFTRKGRQCHKC